MGLLEAFFVMVSALSAALAVRDSRLAREEERRDRWRRELESRLDALADAVVGVGEAAVMWSEQQGQGAAFEAAQLRLRRALLDALNPWIEIEAVDDLARNAAAAVTTALVEQALDEIANNVERIRDEARKTWREKKRELRRELGRR